MIDTEAQLRARIAELEDQLAARPVIPALPAEYDGTIIEWTPWEEGIVSLCASLDTGCTTCNHPGPILLAFGLALHAVKPRRQSARGRKIRRFRAFRCRACQEQIVYDTRHDQYGRQHYDQIAYNPPRTIPTGEESP